MAVGRESAAQLFPLALVAIGAPGLDQFGDREFIGKFHWLRLARSTIGYSMIPKSGYRFSEKIMLKQQAKAKWRFNLMPFRFSAATPGNCRHPQDSCPSRFLAFKNRPPDASPRPRAAPRRGRARWQGAVCLWASRVWQ